MNAPRYPSALDKVHLTSAEIREGVDEMLREDKQGLQHAHGPATDAELADLDAEDARAPAAFEIKTVDQAEWACMTIFSLENEIARRERALETVKKQLVAQRAFFEPLLEQFYRANPPKRSKTIHLANGDLSMRSQPAKLVVVDEEAVKKWAREHLPAALVASFVENLHKTVVNQHFDATGEIPPGCGVNDSFEKFSVNAPRGAKGV